MQIRPIIASGKPNIYNTTKIGSFYDDVEKGNIIRYTDFDLNIYVGNVGYSSGDEHFASTQNLVAKFTSATTVSIINVETNVSLSLTNVSKVYSFKNTIIGLSYHSSNSITSRFLYILYLDEAGKIIKKDVPYTTLGQNPPLDVMFYENYIIVGLETSSSGTALTNFYLFEYDENTKNASYLRTITSNVRAGAISFPFNGMNLNKDRKGFCHYNTTQTGYSKYFTFFQFNKDFTSVTISSNIPSPTSLTPNAAIILWKQIDDVDYLIINEVGSSNNIIRVCTVSDTNVITSLYTLTAYSGGTGTSYGRSIIFGKSLLIYLKTSNISSIYDIVKQTELEASDINTNNILTLFQKDKSAEKVEAFNSTNGVYYCPLDTNDYQLITDVAYKENAMLFLDRAGSNYSGSSSTMYNWYKLLKSKFEKTDLVNVSIAQDNYLTGQEQELEFFDKSLEVLK